MDQGIHQLAPVKDDSTQTVSSDPERNSFLRHQHSIDDQKRIALDVLRDKSNQIKSACPGKDSAPNQTSSDQRNMELTELSS